MKKKPLFWTLYIIISKVARSYGSFSSRQDAAEEAARLSARGQTVCATGPDGKPTYLGIGGRR